MMKHILFASDLSPASERAFGTLVEFAQKLDAKVTLFHSYEIGGPQITRMHNLEQSSAMHELQQHLESRSQVYLQKLQGELTNVGIHSDIELVRGFAGQEIVRCAQSSECDLIVMANRGLGPIKAWIMDSVSQYVLQHSHCPVMVLPSAKS